MGHSPSRYLKAVDVLFTVGESKSRRGPATSSSFRPGRRFVSRAATHRQISSHPVARMETEWLE